MIRRLGFILAIVALVSGAGLLLRAEPPQDVGSWASIGNAPENRIGAAAVALPDGRTLIAGGLANGTPTDAVVVFDPADSSFAAAGELLEPRAGHTATLLEDGRVLIAGGKVNDILTGDLEIFDPSDGSSTLVATLAMLRSGHAAARIGDGKVLIAGGTGTDGVLQTAEIFDPETGAVSLTGSALNMPRTGASATALIDGRVLIAGGNSGSQATSLIIRALALGELKLSDWWRVLLREIPTGLTLGCILGAIGFLRLTVWQQAGFYDYGEHWLLVGATVFAALVGIVTFGSLAGSMLPFVLQRLRLDPASASAPFVATLVDVSGLVIYFSVALVILSGTLL